MKKKKLASIFSSARHTTLHLQPLPTAPSPHIETCLPASALEALHVRSPLETPAEWSTLPKTYSRPGRPAIAAALCGPLERLALWKEQQSMTIGLVAGNLMPCVTCKPRWVETARLERGWNGYKAIQGERWTWFDVIKRWIERMNATGQVASIKSVDERNRGVEKYKAMFNYSLLLQSCARNWTFRITALTLGFLTRICKCVHRYFVYCKSTFEMEWKAYQLHYLH
jgi:hypothetical protein